MLNDAWGDAEASAVVADSRQNVDGAVFVCMPSASRDTHAFLDQVRAKGAVAAICHSAEGFELAKSLGMASAWCAPSAMNRVAGRVCSACYQDPSGQMRVVGITGTNGKTTTAWMLRDALRALGRRSAYLGTLGFQGPEPLRELANTTPYPVELYHLLDEAVKGGIQDLVMESSSHALEERRLEGVRYDVGVFTNLSQDHLDYHGTMEAYAASKKRLFTEYAEESGKPYIAVLNQADKYAQSWLPTLTCRVMTFGTPESDLVVDVKQVTVDQIRLQARFAGETVEVNLQVGGLFNVENASAALGAMLALGAPFHEACQAMTKVTPVPGRFESVPNEQGIGVLVDYAHTPDALTQLLASVRALQPKRVITVFGCGGDRDRSKRPKMAEAVSQASDLCVVTSDNPRTEDPAQIIADILPGLLPGVPHLTVPDRRQAVQEAIRRAAPGDVVVIAGKGHENYQIIGRTKHHLDDRELAREALEERSK